jgi:isocitrate/isopropylmalate dehydrogenase
VSAKRVVVIEGEDAAPEAIRPSIELIDRLGVEIEWLHPPVGERGIERCGSAFPAEAKRAIDGSDATLFGATSGKSAAALFYLRWGRQTYANVRPARFRAGFKSPLVRPERIDFVIVRENLEDLYLFLEGEVEDLAPLGLVSPTARRPVAEMGPGRYGLKVITEAGTERVCRFAFQLARARKGRGRPGRVTSGTKHNMLPRSDGLFRSVAERVAGDYPEIEFRSLIVDDLAHQLVARPEDFDVVVLPNLYGDVLSDAAAGLVGGLGLAPSGCYGDDYAYFESAHGTAPDIAGRNLINPTATLLSAVMMLEHLGFADAAERLDSALTRTYAEGRVLTPDQGGSASTTEFCEAVAARL